LKEFKHPMLDNVPYRVPTPAAKEPSRTEAGCGTTGVFLLVSAWTIAAVFWSQAVGWFAAQFALIQDTPFGWYVWPLITLGTALLVAVAVVPAALWTPVPRFRAVYRAWAVALGCAVVLGLARAFGHNSTVSAAVMQMSLSLVLHSAIMLATTPRTAWTRRDDTPSYGRWIALVLVPIIVLPWLTMGALGSVVDTLMALVQGVAFGLLVAVIVERLLIPSIVATTRGTGWDIALGGWAAGVVVAILLVGFGFNGNQLLMLFALPPLGYAVATLARRAALAGKVSWRAVALLVGGATAAVLAFVDPAELLLILGDVELPAFALAAAGWASLLAWASGIVLWLVRDRDGDRPSRAVRWGATGAAWLLAALAYWFGGAPGWYGDRLFVVMREQADLAMVAPSGERDERLAATYRTLADHAERTQSDLRSRLDSLNIDYMPYYLVNGLEVNGGPFLRAYLETRPDVDRVLLSPRLRPLPEPLPVEQGDTPPSSSPRWNITLIGADRVWDEFDITGEGIVVGQSDSGVQGDHPALRDNYRGRDGQHDGNWFDPWTNTTTPTDVGGHGTHTLGTAVGREGIGVAPGAEWFGCVNLGRNIGNPARYLDCMQFMLAPHAAGTDPMRDGDPARAAHVINNSWGCPDIEGCDPLVLQGATRALRTAGIFVVASAGNSGPACNSVSDPLAIYDDAFSVGAIDAQGALTSFSSRGPVTVDGSQRPKPDILAPGAEVVSALPQSTYGPNDGTSMAGPHIAGVVALMWSAQPALIGDIDATERILLDTATPYEGRITCTDPDGGEQTLPTTVGIVDAYGAVAAALER
jgi:hypothetical protein